MNKWSESVSKPRRQVLEEDGAMVNPTLRCLRVSQRGVYYGIWWHIASADGAYCWSGLYFNTSFTLPPLFLSQLFVATSVKGVIFAKRWLN